MILGLGLGSLFLLVLLMRRRHSSLTQPFLNTELPAVARRLAAEGATILLWDLNADSLGKTTASQPDWHVRTVDITDFEDVSAALGDALNQLGRIDIMVHCAGFSGKNYRVEDYPNDLWSKIIEINLTGTYHVCKAVVPAMAAAGFGRVINLASMAGKEGMPTVSAYSAAKAGVIAFTKAIAKEYLDGDVRINAIAPSAIETPLLQQMAPEDQEAEFLSTIGKSLEQVGLTAVLALSQPKLTA